MQNIVLSDLAQAIKPNLCSAGHLNRPEYRHGSLTRVIWLYEDDHRSQTRRVIKVFAPVTPSGRLRRNASALVDVVTLNGWNQERQLWGCDGESVQNFSLDRAGAAALVKQLDTLIITTMKQHRNTNHWYR